jgi:predicted nucleic acid-binding protein
MSDLVLVDTSVWVRYLRRDPDPEIVRRVQSWLDAGRAATTEIIKLELLPATRDDAEFQRLSATLDALQQIAPDAGTWRSAARNGFTLRRAGVIVPTTDLIIATLAQLVEAELAHLDRHYELMAPHLVLRTISFP